MDITDSLVASGTVDGVWVCGVCVILVAISCQKYETFEPLGTSQPVDHLTCFAVGRTCHEL